MSALSVFQNLQAVEADLARVQKTLRAICLDLPEPAFEDGTDRPLNAAAHVLGLLTATEHDEIAPALAAVRYALQLSHQLPSENSSEPG